MELTIRKKLFLSFGLSILIPILFICIVIGVQLTKTAHKNYVSSAGKELGHIDKMIEIFIGNAITMVTTLADGKFTSILRNASKNESQFF